MSSPPQASGSTPEEKDDAHCGCATCTAYHSTATQQSPKSKKKKKRYIAPQPDANTFASQQEFLESLSPIAVEQVESNGLRCPICWKTYGEAPDPGFDNSELPVRLRCHHVFGQKCLGSTFGIPKDSRVELQPLSFSPGSRGAALGHRLHTYVAQHGHSLEGKRDSQNNIAQIFSKMMQEAYLPRQGHVVFGDFWWPILQFVGSQATRPERGITFMENAIVIDRLRSGPLPTTSPTDGVIKPGALTSTNTDWSQPLGQAISAFPSLVTQASQFNDEETTNLLSGSNHMASSLHEGTTSMTSQPPKDSKKVGPFSQLAMQWPSQSTSLHSPWHAPQSSLGIHSGKVLPTGSSVWSSGTWEDALTTETNLDKLTALNKMAQKNSTTNDLSPEKTADLNKEMFEVAHKTRLAQQEAQKRLVSTISNSMSGTLAELYTLYLKEAPRLAPDPPTEQRANIVPTSVLMHERDAMATEYKISSPQHHMLYYDEDDEDDEHTPEIDGAVAFFVITRNPCMKPCCIFAGKERAKELPVPSALRWRNDAKIPDACPVCHKVLFLKNKNETNSSIPGSGSYASWLASEDPVDGLSDGGW